MIRKNDFSEDRIWKDPYEKNSSDEEFHKKKKSKENENSDVKFENFIIS